MGKGLVYIRKNKNKTYKLTLASKTAKTWVVDKAAGRVKFRL